jgi:ferredoxin-type protein NapH
VEDLAETFGDPFRQLSDKSVKAWKIERWMIHSVLVFAVFMTGLTLYTYFSGNYSPFGIQTGGVQKTYGFLIGSAFAGVVGTGFYPLMGNRVWCRFGCPLAAYLGIVQRFKSRFPHHDEWRAMHQLWELQYLLRNGDRREVVCPTRTKYCAIELCGVWRLFRSLSSRSLKLENGPEAGRLDVRRSPLEIRASS